MPKGKLNGLSGSVKRCDGTQTAFPRGNDKMHSFFLVVEDSGLEFRSLILGYSGQEKITVKHLRFGDFIEVTNNGRYVLDQGWFISVIINEKERVYLALEDLEASLKGKQMMTFTDVLTKLNEWGHQLNLALDQKNKEWFMFVTRKLLKLQTAIS